MADSELVVKQIRQAELRAMRHQAFRVFKVLLRIVREQQKPGFRLNMRPQDQLRLGIFQVWATRHKVTLGYVLRTLLGYWKEKTRRPGKKSVLGVSMAALTSPKSELILQSRIARDYPGGENISEWQMAARLRLLGLDEPRGRVSGLVGERFPERSLYHYGERVLRRRNRLDKAAAGQWRRRRTWRGNPWL